MKAKQIIISIIQQIVEKRRNAFIARKRKLLKNKNVCVVASNCNGGCLLHDLGLEFKSPFVDLWIEPKDFIKMLKNLKYYLESKLEFLDNINYTGEGYPVALLGGDVKIYFQHYTSNEEASKKWYSRLSRFDYEKIYVLFTDRDGCTENDLHDFDMLPYEHKAVFVHKKYPDIKSAVYIKGFEKEGCVGLCMNYKNIFSSKKYYDDFNYVDWFNN